MIGTGATPSSTHRSSAAEMLVRGSAPFTGAVRAELVRARPAVAVLHGGHQVEAREVAGLFRAHSDGHGRVVAHGRRRGQRRIAPAVIDDQLAAFCV